MMRTGGADDMLLQTFWAPVVDNQMVVEPGSRTQINMTGLQVIIGQTRDENAAAICECSAYTIKENNYFAK